MASHRPRNFEFRARDHYALLHAEPMTSSCTWCDFRYVGLAGDAIQKLKDHRATCDKAPESAKTWTQEQRDRLEKKMKAAEAKPERKKREPSATPKRRGSVVIIAECRECGDEFKKGGEYRGGKAFLCGKDDCTISWRRRWGREYQKNLRARRRDERQAAA